MTKAAAALVTVLLLAPANVSAAQITILCSNGLKAVMAELVPQFEQATKHQVTIRYGLAAALKRQIDAGERFDVAVLTPPLIDELIKTGKIAGDSRTVIARAGMGLAIRAGAAKPDIRTTDALTRTLTGSRSIGYAREGAAGVFFAGLIERLGLAERLKPKLKPLTTGEEVATAVGRGDVELGVLPISEILPVKDVELLGPFPADIQGYAVMVAGLAPSAAQAAAAKELIAFLMAPSALPVIKQKGMEREPARSVFLEDLTWPEVRDAVAGGTTTIIIPTGGTEQNGPHIVLGKHNYLVKYKAGEIASRLGNALVAPVMAYVPEGNVTPPSGHMRFAGTITTPQDIFARVLEYAARSVTQHGFLDIALVGDSGGNQEGQALVAAALNKEWAGTNVRVHHITAYYPGRGDDWVMSQGVSAEDVGSHAGTHDTSSLMFLNPSMLRLDKLGPGKAGDGQGHVGNPALATAAFGKQILEMQVADGVKQIQELRASSRRVAAAAPAGPARAALPPALQQAPVRSDQDVLIDLEQRWNQAFYRKDVAFIDTILADEFMATYDDGSRGDRRKELALAAEFSQNVESAIPDDFTVKIFRDTAVVWFTLNLVGVREGQRAEMKLQYTDVWVIRDGRWQCVSTQSTRVSSR